MDKAEAMKHTKYDGLCAAAGINLAPVGVDTFGPYGGEAKKFLRTLFERYAKRLADIERANSKCL